MATADANDSMQSTDGALVDVADMMIRQTQDVSPTVQHDADLDGGTAVELMMDAQPGPVITPDASIPDVIDAAAPQVVDAGSMPMDAQSPPPIEMGNIAIFADRFTPQNVGGTILERWNINGYCAPTRTGEGIFCIPGQTDTYLSTAVSTQNFQGLELSYVRVQNVNGRFADGEAFVAEWSPNGAAPWFEIERGASSEPGVFRGPLPPEAEGHRGFTLRFRLDGRPGEGKNFWMNTVTLKATVPRCSGHTWIEQYNAPMRDRNGEFLGGSEIFRILPHNGELFATNTYWMDENCPWYGGQTDQWSQILRKTGANEDWQEDYELGHGVLRPEVLRSVTFTMPEPDVNILLASTFRDPQRGRYFIDVWTRDDATGQWTLTTPHEGETPNDPHDISVRQLVVHVDRVTGQEKIILPVGTQGMLEGVYDPTAPGQIAWAPLIPVAYNERVMGMSIANGVVVVGAGNQIWHRVDGPEPRYVMVHDMEDLVADDELRPPMGTYRGMTTIPTPNANTESLIFSWAPDYRSTGTIYRLDPAGNSYVRVAETDIGDLLAADLGVPVWVSLCTYSYFLPVTDPETGARKHLGGCLNSISGGQYPLWSGENGAGLYRGGIYFIRHEDGAYTLREVAGRHNGVDEPRDSVRAIALSPFPGDQHVYFGGHDSSGVISTDMAWMYSAPLRDVLQICAEN